jgi:tetratricopeptide (TPR) repeat protein
MSFFKSSTVLSVCGEGIVKTKYLFPLLLISALSIHGCGLRRAATHECLDSHRQLANLRERLDRREISRVHYRNGVQRLAALCPRDTAILMAAAETAYEDEELLLAQQYLDELLSITTGDSAASVLRAKIALKEGNFRYARRLLENEIKLVPNHSELREIHAAAFYLQGDYQESRKALEAAVRLGAPRWRIAYHLGLIEEALGHREAAMQLYAEVVELRPDWQRARQRLQGLHAD